jgi:glycerate dehydrogenase
MRAAFLDFDTLGPGDIDPAPLLRLLPRLELFPDTAPADVAARVADAEILIVNKIAVDAAVLAAAPRLRLVCLAATGTDNVALDAARGRGIGVANIRDYCAPSVTQHVFALVLSLNQRLAEYHGLLAAGAWQRSANFCLLDFPFHELAGRTLGIVGLGNLGRGVARVAQAFGMNVLAAKRPYRNPMGDRGRPLEDGVQRVPFAELLARSHVVSLHCPLNPETRHLLDATALAHMRPDALLVNTARGALVDPGALLAALGSGTIAGAGIDVLEREPPVAGHPLLEARLPNLIVTPHMAWAAQESRQRALDEIALNIAAFTAGARRNRVD